MGCPYDKNVKIPEGAIDLIESETQTNRIAAYKAKAILGISIALFAAWLFIYIAFEVTENGSGDPLWIKFDRDIYAKIISLRTDFVSGVMLSFTYLGSTATVALVATVALILFRFRKLHSNFRILLASSIGSIILIQATKLFFGRARPSNQAWLVQANGLSFPSGHSAGSFAVLGTVFYALGRTCEYRYQQAIIWSIGILIVLAIGFSRIYLGVHYPTDVFGGFLLGLALLLFSISAERLLFCGAKFNSHEEAK
jgi:undecaprenyl-diphosphatase